MIDCVGESPGVIAPPTRCGRRAAARASDRGRLQRRRIQGMKRYASHRSCVRRGCQRVNSAVQLASRASRTIAAATRSTQFTSAAKTPVMLPAPAVQTSAFPPSSTLAIGAVHSRGGRGTYRPERRATSTFDVKCRERCDLYHADFMRYAAWLCFAHVNRRYPPPGARCASGSSLAGMLVPRQRATGTRPLSRSRGLKCCGFRGTHFVLQEGFVKFGLFQHQ